MQKKSKQQAPSRLHRFKNHPFIVPVITFLVLFMVSLVAFVAIGAKTVGPTDSHIVKLYVDGTSQTVPSRAQTVGDLLKRANITLGPNDVVEPSLDAQINDDNFSVNVYRAHPVTIVDNNQGQKTSFTTVTAQQSPQAIAKQAGITLYPEDSVSIGNSDEAVKNGIISQQVTIDRSVPITINLYGTSISTRTRAKTVGEALADKNIKPLANDTILPVKNTPITPNMQIFVVTVGKQITTVTEDIPAPVQTVEDSAVPAGTTVIKQAGSPGKKVITYELQMENGQEVSRKPIQEVVTVQPVPKIIAKGTKLVNNLVSGDKSAILGAAGVPSSEYYAADFVISRESGWNLAAHNASGCLGLGQACPGSKLVAACPDWQTNATCQVGYFSGYAKKYGGWQGAYNFWVLNGWW